MDVQDPTKFSETVAPVVSAAVKLVLLGGLGSVLLCLLICLLLKNTLVQVWYDIRRDNPLPDVPPHYLDQPGSGGSVYLQRSNQP